MNNVINRNEEEEGRRIFDETLCLAGLSEEEKLTIHLKKAVVAVLRSRMMAREMMEAITGLLKLAEELAKEISSASRKAAMEEIRICSQKCEYKDACELSVPPCLRAEAGIPFDRPLLAYVEDGAIVIKGEEEMSPPEVTGELLRLLVNADVDSEGLNALLKEERIIYGQ